MKERSFDDEIEKPLIDVWLQNSKLLLSLLNNFVLHKYSYIWLEKIQNPITLADIK